MPRALLWLKCINEAAPIVWGGERGNH
jgi:hypothetical protein